MNKKSRRSLNDSVVMEPEISMPTFDMYHLFRLHANNITPAGKHTSLFFVSIITIELKL